MKIFSNFIPVETITCDYRHPPWMNSFIKNLIRAKDNFYKKFVNKSNNMNQLYAFKNLQNHLNPSIPKAKQNYVNKIAQRLGDPNISSKCYWSLLKILLNEKKIPCIPWLSRKKMKFSIIFSLTKVLRFQTEVSYLLNYLYVQIAHYLHVTLQKMTSFE